jgi:hypothetical protein
MLFLGHMRAERHFLYQNIKAAMICLHAICSHIHEFCCNGLQELTRRRVTWRYNLLWEHYT